MGLQNILPTAIQELLGGYIGQVAKFAWDKWGEELPLLDALFLSDNDLSPIYPNVYNISWRIGRTGGYTVLTAPASAPLSNASLNSICTTLDQFSYATIQTVSKVIMQNTNSQQVIPEDEKYREKFVSLVVKYIAKATGENKIQKVSIPFYAGNDGELNEFVSMLETTRYFATDDIVEVIR